MTQFSIDNFFDDLGSKNKTSDSKDLSFKKVYIIFKTDSIGDTLAWIPYVEEFRKKHNCKIVCATYYNNWFKNEYKDIEFVEIGGDKRNPIYPVIDNVHDTYEISYLSHPIWVENLKNPELKGKVIPSLQQLITDILDLEHKEIKPKVSIPNKERDIKEKYVCMAIQSTAQCKYWNCKDGWNEIVRYLKSFGYKVVCIDKSSSFGIEGQYNLMPKGVIDKTGNIPLEERMVTLKYADFLISISSGLSWLSWSVGTPVIMVSSFTKPFNEFQSNNIRVYKEHSNSGFYNTHRIDPWNWNWNPIKECKTLDDWNEFEPITLQQVKSAVDEMIIKTGIKKAYIQFGSSPLGDSIGWIPYCLEYKKKFNVNEVVVSTYWNSLFESVYPELTFVEPGEQVNNVDKKHTIDFYGLNLEEKDLFDNPLPLKDYKECSIQGQATNCLGLEHKEIKPRIAIPDKPRSIKGKYVCIATQTTGQCRYWNLKGGWDAIVRYLRKNGYKVVCIDKYSSFGIEGQYNLIPKEVIDKTGDFPIEDRIVDIKHAEFFVGTSSGLAWVAHAVGTPVVMISGFTKPWNEFTTNIERVHNDKVCNGCWHTHEFNPGDWNFCPENKDFECSKQISFNMVKDAVNNIIKKGI